MLRDVSTNTEMLYVIFFYATTLKAAFVWIVKLSSVQTTKKQKTN